MLMRKINAVISLLTTVFLLYHAIFSSVWMFSGGAVEQSAPIAPWVLAGLVATHAFISIYFGVSSHMEGEQRKVRSYPKMNRVTMFQRISGILLIIFTVLHIGGVTGGMKQPYVVHLFLTPLFFAVALAHAAVSTDKALITLGIGNARAIRIIGIVMRVICAVTLIAALAGFVSYSWR
jgi:hypothetical protein